MWSLAQQLRAIDSPAAAYGFGASIGGLCGRIEVDGRRHTGDALEIPRACDSFGAAAAAAAVAAFVDI